MLACPSCRSQELMIRLPRSLERLKIWYLQTREYRCADCELVFRAEDRRQHPRGIEAAAVHLSSRHTTP